MSEANSLVRPRASPRSTAIAFVVGGAVGAALFASLAKLPPARVSHIDRPIDRSVAASAANPPFLQALSTTTPEHSPTASASVAHASAAKREVSQLSAERLVLEEARAAIERGDPQRGLDRLEQHQHRFPNPLLAEERDALRVRALVEVGRYDDARASAEVFRMRRPNSIFISMVEAAIAAIP